MDGSSNDVCNIPFKEVKRKKKTRSCYKQSPWSRAAASQARHLANRQTKTTREQQEVSIPDASHGQFTQRRSLALAIFTDRETFKLSPEPEVQPAATDHVSELSAPGCHFRTNVSVLPSILELCSEAVWLEVPERQGSLLMPWLKPPSDQP